MTGGRTSTAAAQIDGPAVRIYGRAGSFGALQGATTTPSGDRLATAAVRGWGFLPGQSAYFPAIAPDGTVIIANEPQTDDQLRPTARQMVLSTFAPSTGRFANVIVPTSRGKTTLAGAWTAPSGLTGGGDISDVGVVQGPQGPQVTFLSAMPFWGWNADRAGEFPTIGVLRAERGGAWTVDPRRSRSASSIALTARRLARAQRAANRRSGRHRAARQPRGAAASAPLEEACVLRRSERTGTYGDCRLPAEFDQLPASGALVVAQYGFEDPARPSGRLSVLSPTGTLLASMAYPVVRGPDGTPLRVHPREVVADPLGQRGDERFLIVFDVEQEQGRAGITAAPGVLQEFSFDADRATLRAASRPVRTGDLWGEQALGIETVKYASDGALWVGQSLIGTLQAGPLAIYARAPGARGVLGDRPGCTPGSAPAAGWGARCPPDRRVGEASRLGIARSLDEDPQGRMLLTTMSGYVLPISRAAPGAAPVAGRPLDLGLDHLVDRTLLRIGPRKAMIDPARGSLWIPIQQLTTDRICAAWPCPPQSLDQWLIEVDLRRLT